MNENMMEAKMNLGKNIVDLTPIFMEIEKNRTDEFAVRYKMPGQDWKVRKCTDEENKKNFMKRIIELGGTC